MPDGRIIEVVPMFIFDKGSVPRPLRLFLQRDDSYSAIAFLIHDWLYARQQIGGVFIKRKEADRIFCDLLAHAGMGRFKASIAHRGVRFGGWIAWNRAAKLLQNRA